MIPEECIRIAFYVIELPEKKQAV